MARKNYHDEPSNDIRVSVWESGHWSALQMFRVAAWKSAQGLAPLTLNQEDAIAARSAGAIEAITPWREEDVFKGKTDWDAWRNAAATAIGSKPDRTGLLGLEGFGYPMASAFLSFLLPAVFPVIDRWTIQAVYGAGVAPRKSRWHRSHVYAHFAQELVQRRNHFAGTDDIHRVDQAVMNAAKTCEHPTSPCACYPFWPVDLPDG